MNNISIEQILKVNQPTIGKIFKVIMILVCIVCAIIIPQTYAIGVLLLAVAVVVTVFIFKYYDAEYEYSLVENELTVDKIMSKSMRKRCGQYNLSKAEIIAPVNSQEALRLEHKKLKAVDYTSNTGSENIYVLYLYNETNEMSKILIEPDDKMLAGLKTVAPRNFVENN